MYSQMNFHFHRSQIDWYLTPIDASFSHWFRMRNMSKKWGICPKKFSKAVEGIFSPIGWAVWTPRLPSWLVSWIAYLAQASMKIAVWAVSAFLCRRNSSLVGNYCQLSHLRLMLRFRTDLPFKGACKKQLSYLTYVSPIALRCKGRPRWSFKQDL